MGKWHRIRCWSVACTLRMSVILAPLLDLRRVRIRDLVLSPVLAELLQLPAPASGPSHPASPQGGPDTSAAFINSTADGRKADGTISAARASSGSAGVVDLEHEDRDDEDGNCLDDGSWLTPQTAARLVDLFHGLAGDRGLLLPADLVK